MAFFQSSGHPVSDDAMKPGEKEMKKESLDSKKPTAVNAEPEPEPETEPEPVTGNSCFHHMSLLQCFNLYATPRPQWF